MEQLCFLVRTELAKASTVSCGRGICQFSEMPDSEKAPPNARSAQRSSTRSASQGVLAARLTWWCSRVCAEVPIVRNSPSRVILATSVILNAGELYPSLSSPGGSTSSSTFTE